MLIPVAISVFGKSTEYLGDAKIGDIEEMFGCAGPD
jgi:hypothetical protein